MNTVPVISVVSRTQQGPNVHRVVLEPTATTPLRSLVVQEIERLSAIVQYSATYFQQLQQRYGGQWNMSVFMDDGRNTSILSNPGRISRWGVSRRFHSRQEILNLLPAALEQAYEGLEQSKGRIAIDRIQFELRFERTVVAQGRLKAHVKKSIASNATGGLGLYESSDNLCGFQAIIFALTRFDSFRQVWRGSLDWFYDEFEESTVSVRTLKRGGRFTYLAETLAELMGMEEPVWRMGHDDLSGVCALLRYQPALQVIVYNEVTRQIYDHRCGILFDPAKAKESTVLMSYTTGHLHLIVSITEFLGRTRKAGISFCYLCLKFVRSQHGCEPFKPLQCPKCNTIFATEAHKILHCKTDQTIECYRCNRFFFNDQCVGSHRCTASHSRVCDICDKKVFQEPHICGLFKCTNCHKDVSDRHRCSIQIKPEPKTMTPEEAGKHYYAFDLEAMLIQSEKGLLHAVNLAVVRRCFSEENEEHIFYTLRGFIEWIEALPHAITLFAHNLKGYDGRMVFDHLFDQHTPPQEMMWRGSKIMSMVYGKATFKDTLLHFPASLAQLPKMLGLDETLFKKGFFPYLFNTPENQAYRGAIPDRKYFDPQFMSDKKRAEFDKWYVEQTGVYDFHKELVEYCLSDTRILAKAIEAYMTEQMSHRPLNPFSCLTIASYAMTMYRTYYMPENQIKRMTATEHVDIARSMHGGRTDARCLLKEWTPEQVSQGIYGCYQDVQSLYPTVQFYDPMPVGEPTKVCWLEGVQPSLDQINGVFGFVCCDIKPTQYLFHPILVDLDEETGRLISDLLPRYNIVIPTPELQLALQHGYVVTRVYWWYHYEQSTDLFKDYMRDFIKVKLEASGMPSWAQDSEEALFEFETYHHERLGIHLRPDKMVPNPAKKTGAKLMVNSLWGKFGERNVFTKWEAFRQGAQDDRIMALENRWIDGELDIFFRKYSSDNSSVGMVYQFTGELPQSHIIQRLRRGHKNIAVASMVTSHARCRLWTELHKLGERVLYHDTDSIIYERCPTGYNIPQGRYLGEWEDETGGMPMVKFVSTGPKCYSYMLKKMVQQADGTMKEEVKQETKVKGVTLHSTNSALIQFDSMKSLVMEDTENIKAQCISFVYDKQMGTMVTETLVKLLQPSKPKGILDRSTWKVYPFGSEKFIDLVV